MKPSQQSVVDAIIETSHDAFIGMGADGCITHWNHQSELMFGWLQSEALGKRLADLIIPASARDAHARGLSRYLTTGEVKIINNRVHLQALRRSGEEFPVEMTVSAWGTSPDASFFAFLHDASERVNTESDLLVLVRTDSLTELPNRRHLYERLNDAVAQVDRTQRLMAVLFMDIDHFKGINDSLGHDVGDAILKQFAARLRSSVRRVDFAARLGGDEFMVVAQELGDENNTATVAQKILDSMAPPFDVDGYSLQVTTSIGVALYAGSRLSADVLIRRADQAMYQAKRSGRNTFRIAAEDGMAAEQSVPSEARTAMAKFLEAAAANENDVDVFLQNALHSIRIHLGMDIAFISEFKSGRRIFRYVDSTEANPPISVGGSDPLEDSFCQRVVDGRLPELMPDAFQNQHAMSLPVTKALPVRAHLSVPIRMKNGEIYGTYCCFSSHADQSMNSRDLDMMRIFAELIGRKLETDFVG